MTNEHKQSVLLKARSCKHSNTTSSFFTHFKTCCTFKNLSTKSGYQTWSPCKCLNFKACKFLNFKTCKCLNFKACKCLNFKACKCLNFKACKCLNFKTCKCLNFKACKCLKGNIPRISSYTWLFAKNTGWCVVLRSNP